MQRNLSICYLKKLAHSKWKGAKSRKIVEGERKEFEGKKAAGEHVCTGWWPVDGPLGADTPATEKKAQKKPKENVSTGWPRTVPLVVVDHLLHVLKRPTVVTGVRDRLPLQQVSRELVGKEEAIGRHFPPFLGPSRSALMS